MKDQRLVDFGNNVRKIRKERGLSQEALAALADIDRSYMGHIERGRARAYFVGNLTKK